MATTEKKSILREDFPGYQGHIPYKFSIIGKTVGATNETIKDLLTTEPPKSTLLRPSDQTDFSHYDRDYYCDTFYRGYPLEEDKIFSNRSKEAQTWIVGDKYKIYPQHIPGVVCHVPGIYSSNIYVLPYSKTTAVSIKGDYNKNPDCTDKERFTSTNMITYTKPKTRSFSEQKELDENEKNILKLFILLEIIIMMEKENFIMILEEFIILKLLKFLLLVMLELKVFFKNKFLI